MSTNNSFFLDFHRFCLGRMLSLHHYQYVSADVIITVVSATAIVVLLIIIKFIRTTKREKKL